MRCASGSTYVDSSDLTASSKADNQATSGSNHPVGSTAMSRYRGVAAALISTLALAGCGTDGPEDVVLAPTEASVPTDATTRASSETTTTSAALAPPTTSAIATNPDLTLVEQTPIHDIELRVIADLELTNGSLSPDGQQLFAMFDAHQGTGAYRSGDAWCLVEIDADEQTCTHGTPFEIGVYNWIRPVWSPDGQQLAWLSQESIWRFDLNRGSFHNLSDGLVDGSSSEVVDRPRNPAWLGNEQVVYITTGLSSDGLAELVRIDAQGQEIVRLLGPTYDVTLQDSSVVTRSHWQIQWSAALATESGTVLIGGGGVLYEVDPRDDSIRVLGDYTAAYTPIGAALGEKLNIIMADPPALFPVAQLKSDAYLLWDPAVNVAINQGLWYAQVGVFVFNTADDTLTPLIEPSPDSNGYIGPLTIAISPNGERAVFTWMDNATHNERGRPDIKISILDLGAFTSPVNLRSLPVLWTTSDFLLAAIPTMSWATNDRFLLTGGDRTVIFQLEAQ